MSLAHSIPTPEQRTWRRIHAALGRWYGRHGAPVKRNTPTTSEGAGKPTPPIRTMCAYGETESRQGPGTNREIPARSCPGKENLTPYPAAGTPASRERAGAGPQAEEAKL